LYVVYVQNIRERTNATATWNLETLVSLAINYFFVFAI